ncbi:uncharacterized protein F5Z01DRAFT_639416 [Emericellopsis atlantica]|uniref:Uncharacterized protein n=1 Tax=Emericellopsis atlantica TaxID=2614577 RepID=A0A9P8CLQ8_9HYPO|nr:uncharacterized protein F5Z01DRAFT_639416 [Emericellopsis atlantica]KAG9251265.1 hypothetical protein F5Z01DRAFT_639416 [Emericellopsis atlantica]
MAARNPPEVMKATETRPVEGSIMSRKREHRGLPASFSYSIGRPRSSPPRKEKGEKKSVKSIVARIEAGEGTRNSPSSPTCHDAPNRASSMESSSQTTTTTTTGKGSDKSVDGSSAATTAKATKPWLAIAPDVEDYSLTLLKYRHYYTVTPLGRCLDVIPDSPGEDKAVVEGAFSGDGASRNAMNANGCPQTKKVTTQSHVQPKYERNPAQVDAFWNSIRRYLHISDEELEGVCGSPAPYERTLSEHESYNGCAVLDKQTGFYTPPLTASSAAPSPLRCLSSVTVTSDKQKPPKKKRLPSTEEKLFEIDAFLREEDPARLASSPTLTTPVGRIFKSSDEYFPRTNTRVSPRRRETQRPGAKKKSWALRLELPEAPPRPKNRLRPMRHGIKVPPVMTAEDEEYNFF